MTALSTVLDGPSPAVLTTYRRDGTAVSSPVWFGHSDGALDVVIAEGDVKLRHLAADPRCALLVFEAVAPFRAVRVTGTPAQHADPSNEVRRSIAARYLGADAAERFVVTRPPGIVLRFDLDGARSWDLTAILPD